MIIFGYYVHKCKAIVSQQCIVKLIVICLVLQLLPQGKFMDVHFDWVMCLRNLMRTVLGRLLFE